MPAVFVHGVPDTGSEWDAVRGFLTRADVVAPNLPGFGTPLPAGFEATKEEYADWLTDEIRSIGVPVDIVGHDWGSILVQRVVSLHPELIRTWAAGAGPIDRDYVWHDLAKMWQTPGVGEEVMEAMVGDAIVDGLADQVGRERAVEMTSHIDDEMKDCILKLYRSAAGGFDEWHDAVDTITRPGIVFWGADDAYVGPEFGERLAKRTNARLEMYPDSGHWWPITKAQEVATALEELWSTPELA
jgi:pimeloyl-ACP methyl ester carboxylesterase